MSYKNAHYSLNESRVAEQRSRVHCLDSEHKLYRSQGPVTADDSPNLGTPRQRYAPFSYDALRERAGGWQPLQETPKRDRAKVLRMWDDSRRAAAVDPTEYRSPYDPIVGAFPSPRRQRPEVTDFAVTSEMSAATEIHDHQQLAKEKRDASVSLQPSLTHSQMRGAYSTASPAPVLPPWMEGHQQQQQHMMGGLDFRYHSQSQETMMMPIAVSTTTTPNIPTAAGKASSPVPDVVARRQTQTPPPWSSVFHVAPATPVGVDILRAPPPAARATGQLGPHTISVPTIGSASRERAIHTWLRHHDFNTSK
eukprot:PhM_4_TR12947/c0_g1_i1/m.5682